MLLSKHFQLGFTADYWPSTPPPTTVFSGAVKTTVTTTLATPTQWITKYGLTTTKTTQTYTAT
jgi:hypothetical protein